MRRRMIALVAAGVLALSLSAPVSAAGYSCASWAAYIQTAPAPIAVYLTKVFAPYCHW